MNSTTRMIVMLGILISSLSGFAQSPLEVRLAIPGYDTTEFPVGENIPLEVTIQNISDEEVYIVLPIYGSKEGYRYPEYKTVVSRPLQIPVRYPETIDIVVFPIQETNFMILQPGESTETMHFDYNPIIAGKFEITFEVKYDASPEAYWIFEDATAEDYWMNESEFTSYEVLMEMYDKIPKINILSNKISVQVVSNGDTLDPNHHCLMGMTEKELPRIYRHYLRRQPENPRIFKLPVGGIWPRLHLTPDSIVDGVEIVRPENSHLTIHEDYVQWIRGDVESIPLRVEYDDEGISAIRAGYFADPSSIPKKIYTMYP